MAEWLERLAVVREAKGAVGSNPATDMVAESEIRSRAVRVGVRCIRRQAVNGVLHTIYDASSV